MNRSNDIAKLLSKIASLFGQSEYNHDASETGEDAAWRSKAYIGRLGATDAGMKGFLEALAEKNKYSSKEETDPTVAYDQL